MTVATRESRAAEFVYASDYSDAILMPRIHSAANGGAGADLFCTAVSNAFYNPFATWVLGDAGTDTHYGPTAATEQSIEIIGGVSDRDRCDLAYLEIAGSVLNMLAP